MQGEHEVAAQIFVHRVAGGEHRKLREQVPVPAQAQIGHDSRLQHAEPALLEPGHLHSDPQPRMHVHEHVPAPQIQSLAQQRRGELKVGVFEGLLATVGEPVVDVHVNVTGAHVEQVAAVAGPEHILRRIVVFRA